jgi:hypothetical protein
MCVVGVYSIVSCTVEICKYYKLPHRPPHLPVRPRRRPPWHTLPRLRLSPTLDNHEGNSEHYFDLFYLPGNERWYTFDYGNARFACLQVDGSARYERNEVNGITYVVTAGGGAPLYAMQEQEPTQAAFALAHHFVLLKIDGHHLRAMAISSGGEVLDEFEYSTD